MEPTIYAKILRDMQVFNNWKKHSHRNTTDVATVDTDQEEPLTTMAESYNPFSGLFYNSNTLV